MPSTTAQLPNSAITGGWNAVFSMSLCVAILISSEFMPASLLTPMAHGLGASQGATGQAIAISGFFAVATSLVVPHFARTLDRKWLLVGMTALMVVSLVLVAWASGFMMLMVGRAFLGVTIGGFWSMATAVLLRLVPPHRVSTALAVMYAGQACAAAFAAPVGSYLGGIIGWRGVFWALVPLAVVTLVWQIQALPSLPVQSVQTFRHQLELLRRRYFVRGLLASVFTFAGAFAMFTYLRPYLEDVACVHDKSLAATLLMLGIAGFIGSWLGGRLSGRHTVRLLIAVPSVMVVVTLVLISVGHWFLLVAVGLCVWGIMSTLMSVGWMAWVAQNVDDEPEAAGSWLVAAIQAAILCGSAIGGWLLDHFGITATFMGSAAISVTALVIIGRGNGLLKAG